jgi:hypothetical protein
MVKILVLTYPTPPRHPLLPGASGLPVVPNFNWDLVQPQRTHGSVLGLLPQRGRELGVGSRFLEFPILIDVAEIAQVGGIRQAHAPTRNNVGGYMKGESEKTEETEETEKTEKPKTLKSLGSWLQCSGPLGVCGLYSTLSRSPRGLARGCSACWAPPATCSII